MLRNTCWINFTLDSPNACTVHVVPGRIVQLLEMGCVIGQGQFAKSKTATDLKGQTQQTGQ